jgi:4-alpha-glucanotransferase
MIDTKEKLAGLLIPASALRRDGDLGIGDTQAVVDALDFCVANNVAVLQLLPINETGGDNSPYNAISSVALDPVLLTIAPQAVTPQSAKLGVPGLEQKDIDRLATQTVVEELTQGPVKYARVKQLKLAILHAAFESFQSQKSHPLVAEFEQFCRQEQSWLESYCVFRMLMDVHNGGTDWPRWTEEQRTLAQAKKWIDGQKNKSQLHEDMQFHAFVQWVTFRQWRKVRAYADKVAVQLLGDIPFAVSRFSADVWAQQELFDLDWSAGAPAEWQFQGDSFTAKWGQNWGFPLYRWPIHRQENFKWWHQRVAKVTEIFHGFRIDHVLGFFRIYAFPWMPENNDQFANLTVDQAKEKTGGLAPRFFDRSDETEADRQANARDGKALLQSILEAASGGPVVAEDLGGMVPDYVRQTLHDLGIPGFGIPQWDRPLRAEYKSRETFPALSLATYATHDHSPIVGHYQEMVDSWLGPDGHEGWLEMQRLMRFLRLDDNAPPKTFTPELHVAFMDALIGSPSWLVVFMITDLLAINKRFNQPGSFGESSWSERLDKPLSWYQHNAPFKQAINQFSRLVKQYGRLPHAWQVGTISKDIEE